MPDTRGTTPTQMRFSDEDKARMDAIKERYGLPSRTAAVRMAVTHFAAYSERLDGMPAEPPKKSRKGA